MSSRAEEPGSSDEWQMLHPLCFIWNLSESNFGFPRPLGVGMEQLQLSAAWSV
jgi:hypothetical protein